MSNIQNIPTIQIQPGNNDRTKFDQAALQELAASIQAHGLAQPITVRPIWTCARCGHVVTDPGEWCDKCKHDEFRHHYQIVAGERRFRAVRDILQQDTIPAIVRTDLTDEAASAIMLAENVARADLDPIDEGRAYQYRMDTYSWSIQDCADRAGVSTVRVHFRLKLLRLRDDVQKLVRDGNLPIGYAQILADANLDANRQLLAIARLRDNPHPTPPWFRREVGRLLEQQSQESLFNADAFLVSTTVSEEQNVYVEPPHPTTTTPPIEGQTTRDKIINQVTFWRKASEAWDALGKPFKRQECQAAAEALSLALAAI